MKINEWKLSNNFRFIESDDFESKYKDVIIENLRKIENFNDNNIESKLTSSGIVLECLLKTFIETRNEPTEDFANKNLHDLISFLNEKNYFNSKTIFATMHNIRKKRNRASHANDDDYDYIFSKIDVVQSLKDLYSIIYNLFITQINKGEKYKFDESCYSINISDERINAIPKKIDDEFTKVYSDLNIGENTIREWLTIPNSKLIIPVYQRSYDWKKENILILINDIKDRVKDQKSHYFGTVAQKKIVDNEWNKIKIIDGQQRITTSILIVCAVRDIFFEERKFSLESKQMDWFKEIWNDGKFIDYVYNPGGTSDNNNAFNKIVKIGNIEQKINTKYNNNFFKNYSLIYDELKQLDTEELIDFVATFLNNFIVASINFDSGVYPSKEEMTIFENLNSKGVQLDESDLIKNYLLTSFDEKYLNENEDKIGKQYNKIFTQNGFDIAKKDKFIEFYITLSEILNGKEVPKDRLTRYKIIKETLDNLFNINSSHLKNDNNMNEFFNKLDSYIRCYAKTVNKESDILRYFSCEHFYEIINDKKKYKMFVYFTILIKDWIENKFKVTLIDDISSRKEIDFNNTNKRAVQELFLTLTKYLIRTRIITKQGDSSIKRKIIDIAHNTYKNLNNYSELKDLCNDVISMINELYKNKKDGSESEYSLNLFRSSLEKNDDSNSILPLLLLTELYMNDHIFQKGEGIKRKDGTIEHIMPKKLDLWFKNNKLEETDEIINKHNNYKEKIGNYLVLTRSKNAKAQNYILENKQEKVYKNLSSKLYINDNDDIDVSRKKEWTFENIDKRTKALIDYILKNVITE